MTSTNMTSTNMTSTNMTSIDIHVPCNFPLMLIYRILNYIHKPQPKILLNDISHYCNSKQFIHQVYKTRWQPWTTKEDEYVEWLINDISMYANMSVPSMYGYTTNYYQIFLRIPWINPVKMHRYYKKTMYQTTYPYKIYKYILSLNRKYITYDEIRSRVNILWGLMTYSEREWIIHCMTNLDE